jgi:hypothetical protein
MRLAGERLGDLFPPPIVFCLAILAGNYLALCVSAILFVCSDSLHLPQFYLYILAPSSIRTHE